MEIYLVQHANSQSREEDPERPLTEEGFRDIRNMAGFAQKNISMDVNKIYHSGKLRARQTAEELAARLRPPEGVEETDNLGPMADPEVWSERITRSKGGIMLVGHLPHLAGLAGVLLCGDKVKNPINFHNAGIVKLIRDSNSRWQIDWIAIPSVMGS